MRRVSASALKLLALCACLAGCAHQARDQSSEPFLLNANLALVELQGVQAAQKKARPPPKTDAKSGAHETELASAGETDPSKILPPLPGLGSLAGTGGQGRSPPPPAPNSPHPAPSPPSANVTALGTSATTDIMAAIEQSRGKTRQLPVLYRTPSSLPFDEAQTFRLVIAGKDLDAAKTTASGSDGVPREVQLAVLNRVRAELTGDARYVDITPTTPAEQPVTEAANTVWEWRVVAKRPGTVTLAYHVYNVAKVDGQDASVQWEIYEKKFDVTLTWPQRLKLWWRTVDDIWKWLVAGVPPLVAAIMWAMSRFGKPRDPPKKRRRAPSSRRRAKPAPAA